MAELSLSDVKSVVEFLEQREKGGLSRNGFTRPTPQAFKVFKHAIKTRGVKHDVPSGTPSGPYLTGPGGVWGVGYSLQQDVLSTRMTPKGLFSSLPWYPSNDMNPIWPYFTGFTNPAYTPPDGPCDFPTPGGDPKTCTVSYPFGKYQFAGKEFAANETGRRINRGEMRDLRFVNDPLGMAQAEQIGMNWLGFTGDEALLQGREWLARAAGAGVQAQNMIGQHVYTGDPANNTNGGYAEIIGLDLSIKEGVTDYLNPSVACPTLDSIVVDLEYADIEADATAAVSLFSSLMSELQDRADAMNLEVNWENKDDFSISMPRRLFWVLTAFWPCSYLTNRCLDADGAVIAYVGGSEQVTMRDTMRNSRVLWINGLKINIEVDDFIPVTAGDGDPVALGCFSANIYGTTKRVSSYEVLYWEYFNYMEGLVQTVKDARYLNIWSDNGIWAWTTAPNVAWCIVPLGKIEPRLVNLGTMLDFKITNVEYCPDDRVTYRAAHPSNPGYVNGGVSTGRPSPFPPMAMTACNPPDGQDDVLYVSYTFTAAGGTAPYTWFGAGLPTGLSLHAVTGVLSGTPTAAATFNPVINAVDANGLIATCQPSIVIAPA